MSHAAALTALSAVFLLSSAAPTPDSGARTAGDSPWKLDKEHRFVWIRDSQKVGETLFRIRQLGEASRPLLVITAKRNYHYETTHQEAESTTVLRRDATPVSFEEELRVTTVKDLRGTQTAKIRFEDSEAHARYIQNGREDHPTTHTLEMPPGTFLFASQAVEHWALFTAGIPRGAKSHTLKLYYPDFRKVLTVDFENKGAETVTIGEGKAKATKYDFRSSLGTLKGSIWLGDDQRLLQIEFPAPASKVATLRVVLAK